MLGLQASHLAPLMLFLALGTLPATSAFQPFPQSTHSTIRHPPTSTMSLLASSQSNTVLVDEAMLSATVSSKTVAAGTITPTIQTLQSLPDFLNYIDTAPRNSLAVVEFYGINCPMCKRVSLKYKKIAKTYSKYGVLFAEMEHPANKQIMDVLCIRKFPFLHVYRNGQCVAAHGTESSSTFEGIVTDTIQRELDMTEQDWEQFTSAFASHIQQGTDKINQLRQELTIMTMTTAQKQEEEQIQH